jgi:hydrogenase 3 maturation protease
MTPGEKELRQILSPLRESRTIILGIGNSLKGDDGAGPALCEKLKGKINCEVIDTGTVPENYIQTIIRKAPQALVIVDAVDFSVREGDIKIFSPEQLDSVVISTHTLSPRVFIDMIRSDIDTDVFFIGIQPAHVNLAEPLSPQVNEAVLLLEKILTGIFTKSP